MEDVPYVSKIKAAPPVKRTPSDLLDERAVLARHITRGRIIPSIADLRTHADRYGTEQVVETAAELGYTIESCIRLMDHCDRVDAAAYKKEHPHRKPERVKSSEVRCMLILGIEEEEDDAPED